MVGVPATAGLTVAGLTIAYGFVRPFLYNRRPEVAALLDKARLDVVPVSGSGYGTHGGPEMRFPAVRLSYTIDF